MKREVVTLVDGELPLLSRSNAGRNYVGRLMNPMKDSDLCGHRRGRHDVIMSILAAARKGEIKSKIISKAKLSTTQADAYLAELESRNFLARERSPGKKSFVWKTTSAGLALIDACQICHLMADKFHLG